MDSMTSIQVSKSSKEQWNAMKNHPGESFESMVNRMINTLHEDDSDLLTPGDILEIEKSIKDIKDGKYATNAQLMKRYNI